MAAYGRFGLSCSGLSVDRDTASIVVVSLSPVETNIFPRAIVPQQQHQQQQNLLWTFVGITYYMN